MQSRENNDNLAQTRLHTDNFRAASAILIQPINLQLSSLILGLGRGLPAHRGVLFFKVIMGMMGLYPEYPVIFPKCQQNIIESVHKYDTVFPTVLTLRLGLQQ